MLPDFDAQAFLMGGPACLGSYIDAPALRTPEWKGSSSMLSLRNAFSPLQTCGDERAASADAAPAYLRH